MKKVSGNKRWFFYYLTISRRLSLGSYLSCYAESPDNYSIKLKCGPSHRSWCWLLDVDLPFAESEKIITDIAAVQAVIISSRLKEVLRNVNSPTLFQGISRPIKLVYHPREPFFVVKQASQNYFVSFNLKLWSPQWEYFDLIQCARSL